MDFGDLSDGEKCYFIGAVLLGALKHCGPLFCLWDEPDNYLSMSEVGHLIMELRRAFQQSGQLVVVSHNPEAIRKFSDENTLVFERVSHLEPTRVQWLCDIGYQGDLIDLLIRGDLSNGGQSVHSMGQGEWRLS